MKPIAPPESGCGLPDVPVVALAIMMILMRGGPKSAPELLPVLTDWFGCSFSMEHIHRALRRLQHEGYLAADDDGLLLIERAAAKPVSLSRMVLFGIVGTEFRRALGSADPQILERSFRESPEDEAPADEASPRKRQGGRMMSDPQRGEIRQRVRRDGAEERLQATQDKAGSGCSARSTRHHERQGNDPDDPKETSEE